MTKRPLLACCMIVKNGARTIRALMEDLVAQHDGQPAFDEIVIVDTGSTDETMQEVLTGLGPGDDYGQALLDRWTELPIGHVLQIAPTSSRPLIKLSRFEWIKDFAAARNFAFGLATAEWRGYFDADDRVPDAKHLRKTLQHLTARNPSANALVLAYDYVPGLVQQEVTRFFRLAPGEEWGDAGSWRWEDEIHEFVGGKQKHVIALDAAAFVVTQDKIEAEHATSRTRNREILLDAYERAEKGSAKRGRHAFHLAQDCTFMLEQAAATALFLETAECLPGSSLAASALVAAARIAQAEDRISDAMALAGRAAMEFPMLAEPLQLCGVLNATRGAYDVAATNFDASFKLPRVSRRTLIDRLFDEGIAPSFAALAYAKCGRIDDAMTQLKRVPVPYYYEKEVRPAFYSAQELTTHAYGARLLTQMVEFYLWDTESLKALQFLNTCVPAAFSDQPEVAELRRRVLSKIPHMESWEAYQRYYSEVPREIFFEARHDAEQRAKIRTQTGRGQYVLDWVKTLPQEGPPIRVLGIGSNDASIEEGLLIANPRVQLVLADAAAQTSEILLQLQTLYGAERVSGHDVKRSHYDWLPQGQEGSFDAVILFEVLEHVPNETLAITSLAAAIKPGGAGRIFLSTPNARRWVEPYLTGAADYFPEGDIRRNYGEAHLFWHVRANNPQTLIQLFHKHGLELNLVAADHEGNLIAEAWHARLDGQRSPNLLGRTRVAIFAYGARPHFDPESVKTGFLGGSETAVVYLSEALARQGFDVTVFTEKVLRPELNSHKICRRNGVTWRDVQEFDPDLDFRAVLYWRCPSVLAIPHFKAAKHRKLLWLHDCAHPTGGEGYEGADEVLTLSGAHSTSIAQHDGYEGGTARVLNGLNPAAFPRLDDEKEPRDPCRAVYASSPDRGLLRLLECWPAICERVPEAKLDIYYAWDEAKKKLPQLIAQLEAKLVELKDRGVAYHGGVPQAELHRALRMAGVWAYPTSGPAETFCIMATSAVASGCYPVAPDAGALAETLGRIGQGVVPGLNDQTIDTPEGRELFVEAVVRAMTQRTSHRGAMRTDTLEVYAWDAVSADFAALINRR